MNWDYVSLDDAPLEILDGDRGKNYPKQGEFFSQEYCLFLSARNVTKTGFKFQECQFITEQKDELLRKGKLKRNDIVVTTRGTIGNVAHYNNSVPYDHVRINSGMVIIRADENDLYAPFLYAYFRSSNFFKQVNQLRSGVAQPQLPIRDMKLIKIPFPKIDEQKRIAKLINRYDFLIENNRRRIQLLEESARLLYKEWFVHLRFPGHEHVKIIGSVPEGWCLKSLGEVCSSLEDGDWVETKDQGGEDYRLVQVSNIGDNTFKETGNHRYITEENFKRLRCRELLAGDILISRMPKPIGRGWLVTEMPFKMITIVDAAIAKPDITIINPIYLLYHINSESNISLSEKHATGATRPRISKKNLSNLPVKIPQKELMEVFASFAEDNLKQQEVLRKTNIGLEKARDIFLPRLMNGELMV